MSVLKNKRTTSKAEFVNTANEIYTETINFLSRLSARYSRPTGGPRRKNGGGGGGQCGKGAEFLYIG